MSQRNIDTGSFPNDPSADAIRTAFQKVQDNFTELFQAQQSQAVATINNTPGAGITVNSPTGNVVVSAKIAQVQIQTTTLGLGTGAGPNTAQSAIITTGTTPFIIDIPETVNNVANINLSNTLTANFVIANANISAANIIATANIGAGNISTGNIAVTGNANAGNINATNATITSNISAANYAGGNISVTGNITTSTGNINAARGNFTGNLNSGNANLGNLAVANYFSGDGSLLTGVVSVANSQILLGTSNVRIPTASGNVTVSVGGTSNTVVFTSTGVNIAGYANIVGNANVGNLGFGAGIITGTGNVTAGNFIGTLANGNSNVVITANGNVTVSAVGGTRITATSSGANITGTLGVTGNANVGNIGATNANLTAMTVTGNANVGNIGATNANLTAMTVTGNANVGNIGSSGVITATGNVSGGNLTTAGALSVTGNANVGNIGATNANLTAMTVTGNANVGNLGTTGLITATGNVSGGNLTTSGALSVTGNANIGNIGTTNAIITGTANISGNLTAANVMGVLANGTSNVSIPSSGGNVTVSVGATSNVAVITATGANFSGNINATGNIVAGTGSGGSITGANLVSANFIGGTLTTAAQPNITSIGTLSSLTVSGNITGGNIIGTIAAGANTITTTGNANVGNLGISGIITATGNITGGNLIGPHANGNSNINIPAANGNVTVSVSGNSNVVVVTGTGINVAGTINSGSANITGGNIIGTIAAGANTITTTGNANVGNLGFGSGTIIGTGNANVGNLNVSGKVTASTIESNVTTGTSPLVVQSTTRVENLNVAYANVADFTNVSNLTTGTQYIMFANAVSGNVQEGANAVFVANIANGQLSATLLGGTLTTGSQPNITGVSNSFGNLTFASNSSITLSGANSNIAGANRVAANYFVGDGSLLTNIAVSTGSYIVNGNSNVSIPSANGNVLMSVSGISNVVTISGSGAAVNGNITVSGNIVGGTGSGGSFTGANLVSANFFTGTLTTAAQPNITSVGNLTTLTVSGISTLGPISNVKITGGANQQFLITDGTGNLSWLTPTTLTVAPGSNTQVLFNDAGSFAANSSFTFNKTTGNANVGNIGATNGVFTNLTGTLTTASQPNITSIGALTSLIVSGSFNGNVLNGKIASLNSGSIIANSPAVTVVQEWNNASITFTAISANITDTLSATGSRLIDLSVGGSSRFSVTKAGNIAFSGTIAGDGSGLSGIPGANVTGQVSFAATANSVAGANVSGTVANATAAATIAVSDQSGNANTFYPAFVAGTSSGTPVYLDTSFVYVPSTDTLSVGRMTGTLTTNAQPNITSVGTLTSLAVTGNITGGNLSSTGILSVTGNANVGNLGTSGNITAGNLSVTGNANVGNLGTSGNITAGNFIGQFANGTSNIAILTTNGNIDFSANARVALSVASNGALVEVLSGTLFRARGGAIITGNAQAGSFIGPIANGNSNINIASAGANVAISVTGTSNVAVFTPTGVNVTGTANISGNANIGNLGTAQVLATANVTAPQLISNVATGTAPLVVTSTTQVANLNAATAGTVTTNAQPNITSVGTLSSLAVTGNTTSGNVYANSGTIGASLLTGTLTTAAQPNITSTGSLTSPSLTANSATGRVSLATDSGGSISMGRTDGVNSLPYIDFNTSATVVDYDARIQASGNTGTVGGGTLTFSSASANFTGTINGNGSGISAITGANVTGQVSFAATANSVAWSNVSGRPTTVSSFTNDSGYITTNGRAYPRRSDGTTIDFIWSGQAGQPSWLWGGNDGANMYVYNPSNFSVNYANISGGVSGVTLQAGLGTGNAPTFSGLTISSDVGGGYGAAWAMTNNAAGAANKTKNFRISPVGTLEFINNAYTTVIASLTDAGTFTATNLLNNGNQVLHAGNYNSYSPTLTGGGASGTWSINVTGSAGYASAAGSVNTTCPVIGYALSGEDISYNGQGGPQIQSQGGGASMISFHRPGAYAINLGLGTDNQLRTGGWSRGGSYVILDSGNYNSYVPTLTGGGASGTWSINVTGSAGSVAWTNVSGRPTAVSAFTNDSGYITSSGSISGSAGTFTSTTQNSQFNSIGAGTGASGTAGEIRATNNITAYYSSDATLKENVKPIENALDKVNAIGGKTFDWKDSYIQDHGGEDGYFIRKNDFGVIAQDVQSVFPLAVRERQDGTLAVDYEKLCALAFQAIKELSAQIDELKGKL